MRRPNFFIIGAPRCGTSSLYEGVRQHPEIYMSPVKEPWFYSIGARSEPFKGPKDADYNLYLSRSEYEELFASAADQKIVGEASTDYLYCDSALSSLRSEFPDAKLVALLRNPAERAYSHYVQHCAQGREPCRDFWEAIEQEEQRKRQDWCHYWYYRSLGYYGRQLARYYKAFDRSQLQVILVEDLYADPEQVYCKLFDFLGVDPVFKPDAARARHNASQMPRNWALHKFLTHPSLIRSSLRRALPRKARLSILGHVMGRRKMVKPPGISPQHRAALLEGYREDIELTQELIGRDLSHWLS